MRPNDFIYTVNSTDFNHYNRIFCNIEPPITEYSTVAVTELTTKCSILVLSTYDYFTINSKQYFFQNDYTDLNSESFAETVDDMIADDGYYCELDSASRIHIFAANEFELGDMTYNCRLLFGLTDIALPIVSKENPDIETDNKQEIFIPTVGFTLSTPVLYLLSNIGAKTFKTNENDASKQSGLKTAMRLNNSYSANYPIVSGNSDFESIVKSNDLTNCQFVLVDANLHEITLLSPLYITIRISGIEEEDKNIYSLMMNYNNEQQ